MTLFRDLKYQSSVMSFPIPPHLLRTYHGNDFEIGENSLHALTRLQPDMGQIQAKALSAVAPRPRHRAVSTLAHVLGLGLIPLGLARVLPPVGP